MSALSSKLVALRRTKGTDVPRLGCSLELRATSLNATSWLNHDGFVDGLVLPEAADGERGAVERAVLAVVQQLRQGQPGGRGFHRAVAGEAGGEVQAGHVRV